MRPPDNDELPRTFLPVCRLLSPCLQAPFFLLLPIILRRYSLYQLSQGFSLVTSTFSFLKTQAKQIKTPISYRNGVETYKSLIFLSFFFGVWIIILIFATCFVRDTRHICSIASLSPPRTKEQQLLLELPLMGADFPYIVVVCGEP